MNSPQSEGGGSLDDWLGKLSHNVDEAWHEDPLGILDGSRMHLMFRVSKDGLIDTLVGEQARAMMGKALTYIANCAMTSGTPDYYLRSITIEGPPHLSAHLMIDRLADTTSIEEASRYCLRRAAVVRQRMEENPGYGVE